MKKDEYLKIWKSKPKIEDMKLEELKKYMKMSIHVEFPEIIPIPYLGNIDPLISYEYPELVALCPMTGLPDTYTIKFLFTPNGIVPELKSLKMYLVEYLDMPISHEHLHFKIYNDFMNAIKPFMLRLQLTVSIRGGIKTTIDYEYKEVKIL